MEQSPDQVLSSSFRVSYWNNPNVEFMYSFPRVRFPRLVENQKPPDRTV